MWVSNPTGSPNMIIDKKTVPHFTIESHREISGNLMVKLILDNGCKPDDPGYQEYCFYALDSANTLLETFEVLKNALPTSETNLCRWSRNHYLSENTKTALQEVVKIFEAANSPKEPTMVFSIDYDPPEKLQKHKYRIVCNQEGREFNLTTDSHVEKWYQVIVHGADLSILKEVYPDHPYSLDTLNIARWNQDPKLRPELIKTITELRNKIFPEKDISFSIDDCSDYWKFTANKSVFWFHKFDLENWYQYIVNGIGRSNFQRPDFHDLNINRWNADPNFRPALVKALSELRNKNMPVSYDQTELAQEVLDILKDYGYAFGGYVRDQVAGDQFNDLDIFFPSAGCRLDLKYKTAGFYQLHEKLRRAGFDIRDNFLKKKEKYFTTETGSIIRRASYSISKNGVSIISDWVYQESGEHEDNNHFGCMDADVNSLYLEKGEIKAPPNYNLEQIKKHIKAKKFVATGYAPAFRLKKLLDKHWTRIFEPSNEPTQEENNMSNQIGPLERLNQNKIKVLHKVLRNEVSSIAQETVVEYLAGNESSDSKAALARMLGTERGEAFLQMFIGTVAPHAPVIGDYVQGNKHLMAVADELQTEGAATVATEVVDQVRAMLFSKIGRLQSTLEKLDNLEKEVEKTGRRISHGSDTGLDAEREAMSEEESAVKNAARRM